VLPWIMADVGQRRSTNAERSSAAALRSQVYQLGMDMSFVQAGSILVFTSQLCELVCDHMLE
jgi:membrane carboxypeptidase/penicillin-binding protein PbpC